MIKIIFLPETLLYFNELVTTLYNNDYFGFEENAIRYVDDLMYDIKTSLHLRVHKPAPLYFKRYGEDMYYATFTKSKATQWYVFFTKYNDRGEIVFLIRYISNNHLIAKYL